MSLFFNHNIFLKLFFNVFYFFLLLFINHLFNSNRNIFLINFGNINILLKKLIQSFTDILLKEMINIFKVNNFEILFLSFKDCWCAS